MMEHKKNIEYLIFFNKITKKCLILRKIQLNIPYKLNI